ncbi:MAG: sugar phosphate nucleotidyltransferase [Defluviitaleaceae bacterium]|nr:sugar phosphate nucleotidyltransferase [Defluviitaleaceae bacterium]
MKAIILAAGYAQRLYPLTKDKSKALLPIAGKPIIGHIVNSLREISAIDKIFVITNDRFYKDFNNWKILEKLENVEILSDGTTDNDNRLGAIGDIDFVIREKNIDEDLLIIAGDSFAIFPLKEFYDFHIKTGHDCVCVDEVDDFELLKGFATAFLDERGIIKELVEKAPEPKSNLGVYAIYIYKKDTVRMFSEYLACGNPPDAPGYFLQWLHKIKEVYAYKIQGEIIDIGTLESYQDAQERFGK